MKIQWIPSGISNKDLENKVIHIFNAKYPRYLVFDILFDKKKYQMVLAKILEV